MIHEKHFFKKHFPKLIAVTFIPQHEIDDNCPFNSENISEHSKVLAHLLEVSS